MTSDPTPNAPLIPVVHELLPNGRHRALLYAATIVGNGALTQVSTDGMPTWARMAIGGWNALAGLVALANIDRG